MDFDAIHGLVKNKAILGNPDIQNILPLAASNIAHLATFLMDSGFQLAFTGSCYS